MTARAGDARAVDAITFDDPDCRIPTNAGVWPSPSETPELDELRVCCVGGAALPLRDRDAEVAPMASISCAATAQQTGRGRGPRTACPLAGGLQTPRAWKRKSTRSRVALPQGTTSSSDSASPESAGLAKRSLLCQVTVAISEVCSDRLGRFWALEGESGGVIGRVGVLEGGRGAENASVDGGEGLEEGASRRFAAGSVGGERSLRGWHAGERRAWGVAGARSS